MSDELLDVDLTKWPRLLVGGKPGLRCPGCDEPPHLVIGAARAFCGELDCPVLMFDPRLTDGQLDEADLIHLWTGAAFFV